MRLFGAGHIAPVRLMPVAAHISGLIGRFIDRIMQPAMPFRRNPRGFNIAIVNHPTPCLAIDRRPGLVLIIAIALFIDTNQPAAPPCRQPFLSGRATR